VNALNCGSRLTEFISGHGISHAGNWNAELSISDHIESLESLTFHGGDGDMVRNSRRKAIAATKTAPVSPLPVMHLNIQRRLAEDRSTCPDEQAGHPNVPHV
jgi:hypothetical protein